MVDHEVDQEYSYSLKIPLLHTASDTETTHSGNGKYPIRVAILVIILMEVLLLLVLSCIHGWPDFSLAKSSVKGLPSPSSQRPASISPLFAHFLYVDYHNLSCHYCAKNGETSVFYRGVQIAAAPVEEFCIYDSDDWKMREHAWAVDLQMPAFLSEQLSDDTKKHKGLVDVQLSLDHESYNYTFSIDCQRCVPGATTMIWCELSPLFKWTPDHCFRTASRMLLPCAAGSPDVKKLPGPRGRRVHW